jgi:hypothetical protein
MGYFINSFVHFITGHSLLIRKVFLGGVLLLSLLAPGFIAQTADDDRTSFAGLQKRQDDTDKFYTTIGNIGLTITNFGTIGDRNVYWPNQPSCEYPRGSRVEHMYQGALWVGAVSRRTGQIHVSTGSSDRVSTTTGKGIEFLSFQTTSITQRSSLSELPYFDQNAISHQDFLADYADFIVRDSSAPDQSVPLGLRVHQESYAWNFPFADFFVILNYTIYNAGADTLDSVYVGLWTNNVVRNTNNVRPGTTGYFQHGGNGYLDTLRVGYTFDFDGVPTPPPADSYIGIKLLGAVPFPKGVDSVGSLRNRTYYNAWFFNSSSGDADYFSPQDDAENILGARSRYERLGASLPQDKIDPLRTHAYNMTTLLSSGPFATLKPGDSLSVIFGVMCARKAGTQAAQLDTRDQRKTLAANAALCQQAYDGEDVNGNNILDPGEDLNGNGKLDHYRLPQPPKAPKVRAEVDNQNVVIYWDKSSAELSLDPISRTYDFEGYRIYRSNAGADFTDPANLLLNLPLVGEFDRAGDNIGYNAGFGRILLDHPKTFAGDTVQYWFRFPPNDVVISHLNGWQYVYGVAAFDQGDSAAGVTSLQSKTVLARVLPGTAPNDGTKKVGVYPNPYYANAIWDASGERTRKLYFTNLPKHCEVRIYTLAGDIVAEFPHDAATYNGSDIQWFQQFGGSDVPLQFAGGEHAWNLITKFDQAIATGLYLFSVKDTDSGDVQTGKFLVIK